MKVKLLYLWIVKIHLSSPSEIDFLDSPSHPLLLNYKNSQEVEIRLDNSEQKFTPNSEFILLFRNSDINKPHLVLEKHNNEYAGLLTFFPDFNN